MLQIESRQFVREHGLLACIQCGKCTGGCPMAIKTRLNPRNLVYPPDNTPAAVVQYPYYTCKGPDDYFMK